MMGFLPLRIKKWLAKRGRSLLPKCTSKINFGSLHRLTPISSVFGFDRGQPIDRYYIESFLNNHSGDIKERVLEIGDSSYTHKYGGSRVVIADVLHAVEGNPQATIIGDLGTGQGIPKNAFDCIILTQTLLCIYKVHEAITNTYSALKPGGVLLASFPGISQISRYDMDLWGDYWRFTTLSAKRLFEEVFPPENVEVKAYGNVLVAVAFLHGLAAEELKQKELDYHDPDYEVLITVRAVKPETEVTK
jgi:SAM-dependent methyltransferase